MKQRPSYASFNLVKPDGDVFYSVPQVIGSLSLNDRSHFQRALETRDFAIGDYVISRITNNPVLPVAYPILNQSGQIQAMLTTAIDLRWLNNITPNVELPSGTTLTVTDQYGTILYRNIDPEKWVGKSASEVPVVQTVLNRHSKGTVESIGIDGIQRLYAFRPLHSVGGGDIYIYTGIPTKTVFAEVNQLIFRNLLGLVLAGILMLVIAWIGSNLFFLRYVNKLLLATQKLAAGDMSIRTNMSCEQGELGQLAAAFDNMAEALEQRTDQLRENEQRLRLITDNILDMIFLTNTNFIIQYASPASELYLGVNPGDLIGKPIFERVNPEDLPKISAAIETAIKNKLGGGEIFRYRHEDGHYVWFETTGNILFNENNNMVGAVFTSRDITERKRIEDELRKHRDHLEEIVQDRTNDLKAANEELIALNEEIAATNEKLLTSNKKLEGEIAERIRTEELLRLSEERFFKAFNASPLPMAIITLKPEQYIDVNDSFIRTTGYHREEIIGRRSNELKIWADPKERVKIIQTILEQEVLRNLEAGFRTKSGEERVVLLSAEIIDLNGEQCVLTVVNDITERKQLEYEMARLDRLNLVGEMAAGIGHEIRNPMTTVRGFLQMLGSKEECSKYRDFYDLMIGELDRANSIITEFLSLAKNRSVVLKLQNLNTILNALYPLIQADALRVDNYVKEELEDIPDLLLDEKEIRQLILNLVRNGLESMTPNGNLTIKTFIDGGKVVLAVQDQGKGIEPDVLEKIGTPFFTTKDYGTGLGLAVCYSIAARHHATIKIETGPTGTNFFVRFKRMLC